MKGKLLTVPMLAILLMSCHTLDGKAVTTSPTSWATVPVLWEKPIREDGFTIIIGSLRASFGQFRFSWKIEPSGKLSVWTAEPTGTAERPFYGNMELYLWFFTEGKALISRLQKPNLGSTKPALLVPIAAVRTQDLLGVLDSTTQPSAIPEPVLLSVWDSIGVQWKVEGDASPYAYAKDPAGVESKIFPMQIEDIGYPSSIILFRVEDQSIDKKSIECLTPIGKLSTEQFLAAYNKASGK